MKSIDEEIFINWNIYFYSIFFFSKIKKKIKAKKNKIISIKIYIKDFENIKYILIKNNYIN